MTSIVSNSSCCGLLASEDLVKFSHCWKLNKIVNSMKSYHLFVQWPFLFQTHLSQDDRHEPFLFHFITDTSLAPHSLLQALTIDPPTFTGYHLKNYPPKIVAFLCAHVRIKGFWAANHLSTFANQNVSIYNLHEKPEVWLLAFPTS